MTGETATTTHNGEEFDTSVAIFLTRIKKRAVKKSMLRRGGNGGGSEEQPYIEPEAVKELLKSVMRGAINDYFYYPKGSTPYELARGWLFKDSYEFCTTIGVHDVDSAPLTSFTSICYILGMEPSRTRFIINGWKDKYDTSVATSNPVTPFSPGTKLRQPITKDIMCSLVAICSKTTVRLR